MEKHYVVYNDDGEIIEWGMMREETLILNAEKTGKRYLIGLGLPYTHRVDVKNQTIVQKEEPTLPLP